MIGRSSLRSEEDAPDIPILILAFAGVSMHHGVLGAIRSAGRLGIPVYHAHCGRRSAVDSSRYSRGSLTIPERVSAEQALEVLRRFGAGHDSTVLLAVDDASAVFIDENRAALDRFVFPTLPVGLARRLVDKRELQRLCHEHGVETPRATFPNSARETCADADQMQLPVAVKLTDKTLLGPSWGAVNGRRSGMTRQTDKLNPTVEIVRNRRELSSAYRRMSSFGSDVMLQEYIPESARANWMFTGYFDTASDPRVSFTGRKLRQSPAHAGATSLGACEPNAALAELTHDFMRRIAYRGIVDIDFRYDNRDDRYKLLDVNPRIGSSFRLFVDPQGTDVLRAMYLDVTGEEVPATIQPTSRRWIVEPQDLKSALTLLREGDLSLSGWVGSLRHLDEAAWWARDDPRPALALSRGVLAARASRLLRRPALLGRGAT